MKKLITLSFLLLWSAGFQAFSQNVSKEATFDPSGKAKITNLTEVQVDKEKNLLILYYLTKATDKKMKAEILYFDLDFNFIKAENEEEDFEKIRAKYKLSFSLDFCPETKEPLLTVEPNFSGQIVFKKGYIENYYNWQTGFCDNRFKVDEKVKPKGDDGEKIKLINYWSNNDIESYFRSVSAVAYSYGQAKRLASAMNMMYGKEKLVMTGESGDVVFLGLVSEKGMVKENLGKNYVFQKFSVSKLEKIYEKPLNFDVISVPIFFKYLSNGNIGYIFHRVDKKLEYIEVNFDGDVQKRYTKEVPTDGIWVIDDLVETENGDILISGVVSGTKFEKTAYGLLLYPQNISSTLSTYALKPSGFQLMKVNNKEVDFITFTSIKEFAPKFVNIDGEKKAKPYTGGKIVVGDAFQLKNGDIVVSGQKKNNKGKMQEIVAFYFDKSGKLIANYSTPMRDKNDYNEFSPTRQSFMNSPGSSDVYWTIYEVAGAKKRGETARILYTPRITKINAGGKKVNQFLEPGQRKYFLDDKFPLNYVDDNTFIFIGSDRKGKEMWFSKIYFE